jgi:hypothetical protein
VHRLSSVYLFSLNLWSLKKAKTGRPMTHKKMTRRPTPREYPRCSPSQQLIDTSMSIYSLPSYSVVHLNDSNVTFVMDGSTRKIKRMLVSKNPFFEYNLVTSREGKPQQN